MENINKESNCSAKGLDNFTIETKLSSYRAQLEYFGRQLVDISEENQLLKCQIENSKATGQEIEKKYETIQKELEKEKKRIKDIQELSKKSEGSRPEIQAATEQRQKNLQMLQCASKQVSDSERMLVEKTHDKNNSLAQLESLNQQISSLQAIIERMSERISNLRERLSHQRGKEEKMIANTNIIAKDIQSVKCERKDLEKKLEQSLLDHCKVDEAVKKLKINDEKIENDTNAAINDVNHIMSEKSQLLSHKEKLDQKNYELQTCLMKVKQNYEQRLRNDGSEAQQQESEETL